MIRRIAQAALRAADERWWFIPAAVSALAVSLGAVMFFAIQRDLSRRIPISGTIVTTYTTTGGIGNGSGWTIVDLDDGRRMTLRGIRGVAGERLVFHLLPKDDDE